ncbi:carbohydrate ABC transporter permease [Microlunatus ginsengisoli]|uniref:Carbohydrate ABC transporter permease n=1 Tax=Microlunatus ginsengisoli TaxID=363863 RepID=A0ABP7AMJ7_9ACTN
MSAATVTLLPPRRRSGSATRLLGTATWFVAVIAVSISTVLPLIWTLSTSLKPEAEIISSQLSFIPRTPTVENYVSLFVDGPFARYLANSFIIAAVGTITNIFFGSLGGYALAKLQFRGRGAVFGSFLASMMIPAIVTMIPTFLVLRHFPLAGGNDLLGQGGIGFLNSYAAVLVPYAAGAFAVFFMKQVYESLPSDLGEAARIDGASEFRIFTSIYFPLSRAGAAVLAVLTFQAGWNAFLWPLIVFSDPNMYTAQVGLASYVNEHATLYGPLMAGTIVTSIPVLIIFMFAQKYIVQNFATSGGK